MILALAAVLAGLFSILAPCILPMLPVLLARGVDGKQRRALWVIAGLTGSIFVFSVLLKSTTLLIDVPSSVWASVSGSIIIVFALSMLLPTVWERVIERFNLRAQQGMAAAARTRGRWGDVLLGASLGPVFSACSPTYLLIVAVILPQSPLEGLVYLILFLIGLAAGLFAVAWLGSRLVKRLGWSMDPDGAFRRGIGLLLLIVGVFILTGLDKTLLSWLVSQGWYDWQVNLENWLAF